MFFHTHPVHPSSSEGHGPQKSQTEPVASSCMRCSNPEIVNLGVGNPKEVVHELWCINSSVPKVTNSQGIQQFLSSKFGDIFQAHYDTLSLCRIKPELGQALFLFRMTGWSLSQHPLGGGNTATLLRVVRNGQTTEIWFVVRDVFVAPRCRT